MWLRLHERSIQGNGQRSGYGQETLVLFRVGGGSVKHTIRNEYDNKGISYTIINTGGTLETNTIIISLVGSMLTLMLGIIGWLINNKFTKWDETLQMLDGKIDYQITKQNEYDYRINKLELRVDKHSMTIDDINSKLLQIEVKHKLHYGE